MSRGYLAIGIGVVLAAIIGLYITLSSHADAPVERPSRVARNPDRGATTSPRLPGEPTDRSIEPRRGRTATDLTTRGAGSAYTIGGVQVRDHRSGTHPPLDVPPVIHPPQSRGIPSQLSHAISQKVRAVVAECAASVPQSARGAKPRIEGQITIAINNRHATITAATVQLRDVSGVALEPVKHCVEQKSIGATTASGDEPDVEGYGITLSIRLP